MNNDTITQQIEELFRKQVRNDRTLRNAYLLVHSARTGLHLDIAEGRNGNATPQQPNYMASVGKLFTAAIVGMLHEQGKLSFEDRIADHLDAGLIEGLHVHKGVDYSSTLQIRHLLNQTSGLPDNFYPLFDRLLTNFDFSISPREAVEWAKQNLSPSAPPGEKAYYTDTNYHLLGLIIENVRKAPFHEALHEMIFDPLGMKHSFMLHVSEPRVESAHPVADFYFENTRLNERSAFAGIDYAGGGVVAPLGEVLLFQNALINGTLLSPATLETMQRDKAKLYPNFDYGYGIWQLKPLPLLIPAKFKSWGVLGATGAFMFYHPELDACLIGNFNHSSWQKKSVRFMFKVFNILWKHSG